MTVTQSSFSIQSGMYTHWSTVVVLLQGNPGEYTIMQFAEMIRDAVGKKNTIMK